MSEKELLDPMAAALASDRPVTVDDMIAGMKYQDAKAHNKKKTPSAPPAAEVGEEDTTPSELKKAEDRLNKVVDLMVEKKMMEKSVEAHELAHQLLQQSFQEIIQDTTRKLLEAEERVVELEADNESLRKALRPPAVPGVGA